MKVLVLCDFIVLLILGFLHVKSDVFMFSYFIYLYSKFWTNLLNWFSRFISQHWRPNTSQHWVINDWTFCLEFTVHNFTIHLGLLYIAFKWNMLFWSYYYSLDRVRRMYVACNNYIYFHALVYPKSNEKFEKIVYAIH